MILRVVIAADHGGVPLNQTIALEVGKLGHKVIDLGTHDASRPDDYPDYAVRLGQVIQRGEAERGILVCGSGAGVSIAANRLWGVRAAVCHDSYSAHQGVEHDDMNVLCLGARIVGQELALELVRTFLAAKFSGVDPYLRRVRKVEALDQPKRDQPKRVS